MFPLASNINITKWYFFVKFQDILKIILKCQTIFSPHFTKLQTTLRRVKLASRPAWFLHVVSQLNSPSSTRPVQIAHHEHTDANDQNRYNRYDHNNGAHIALCRYRGSSGCNWSFQSCRSCCRLKRCRLSRDPFRRFVVIVVAVAGVVVVVVVVGFVT